MLLPDQSRTFQIPQIDTHKGGYDRFSFDITHCLNAKGNQRIVVCVDDPTSAGTQPRGKQR